MTGTWRARSPRGRTAVIGLPYAWLLVFFLIPLAVVITISFSEAMTASTINAST